MTVTSDSVTEKKLEELAKAIGRSKLRVLKDAVQYYAHELKDLDAAMERLNDPHAHLIDHGDSKRALNLVD
jgi:predicted DNA-binding protein